MRSSEAGLPAQSAEWLQRVESASASFQHRSVKKLRLREAKQLAQGHKLGGGMWWGQVDLTPERFLWPPVWPESQQGRFRCVHMAVNDHPQSCQQPRSVLLMGF